ncbi:MAG TPA: arylsulfatase [Pirellulales bacterium]|jgi:arylsulfatase A-like enzyme
MRYQLTVRLLQKIAALIVVATVALHGDSPSKAADNADLPRSPNIIVILADDLGYGDLHCYGQQRIQTPRLDRLAAEGVRFTDCYAGCTVCAPSRCTLMTGLHTGHCRIRGNAQVPLEANDVTVAEVLKTAGYATGIIGKWGLGEAGTSGAPNEQGFDHWFGYLSQHHAHNYYPDFLWRNRDKEPVVGNVVRDGVASERAVYSQDLFVREAITFLDRQQAHPFFLYLAFTSPHANNEAGKQGMEVPSDAPYTNESWPQPQKNHAAMITRLDRDIGIVLDHLQDLGIADKTIVLFSSDNGPHKEGGADPNFFHSSGPLRGIKRDLYEGGIRVPGIAKWPGQIAAGSTSDLPWAFWDVLPTLAEIAQVQPPAGLDGISILPTLVGPPRAGHTQQHHDYLYWEFHERGFQQAIRTGNWKGIRSGMSTPIALYDLASDIAETRNVADANPQVAAKLTALIDSARTESPDWPLPAGAQPSKH